MAAVIIGEHDPLVFIEPDRSSTIIRTVFTREALPDALIVVALLFQNFMKYEGAWVDPVTVTLTTPEGLVTATVGAAVPLAPRKLPAKFELNHCVATLVMALDWELTSWARFIERNPARAAPSHAIWSLVLTE